MPISFCRVDLLLEDPDGKLAEWMDRFQPPDDTRWFGARPVSLNNNRPQSRSGQRAFVGLPLPNYSEPLKPKLNALYWPTGATRWAFGLFLATRAQLKQILATLDVTENLPGTLILYDEEHSTQVNAEMFLLPPHPISTDTGSGETDDDDRLWILPLVDERYFWQFKSVGTLGEMPSDWASLIALMGTALGTTISAADVPTEYGIPDSVELRRDYENAPVYLDALAHSVGMRVTRLPTGEVRFESPSQAHTRYDSNIDEKVWEQICGDNFSSIYPPSAFPEKVTVVFPKYRSGGADCSGAVHKIEVDATDAGADSSFGITVDTVKVIHSTAYADFTDAGADPDNLSDLTDLATQIAGDFYRWLRRRYDMTYAGIVEWTPTGYCDWVEWVVGHRARTPSGPHLQWHTRVRSHPVNFGSEEQCSQFGGMTVSCTASETHRNLIRVRLGAELASGGVALGEITQKISGTWTDSGILESIYEITDGIDNPIPSGTIILAEWYEADDADIGGQGFYVAIGGSCPGMATTTTGTTATTTTAAPTTTTTAAPGCDCETGVNMALAITGVTNNLCSFCGDFNQGWTSSGAITPCDNALFPAVSGSGCDGSVALAISYVAGITTLLFKSGSVTYATYTYAGCPNVSFVANLISSGTECTNWPATINVTVT